MQILKEVIHKPRGQLRVLAIWPYALFSKSDHEGGRGVKNTRKCDHVVYGWPRTWGKAFYDDGATSMHVHLLFALISKNPLMKDTDVFLANDSTYFYFK